MNWKIIQKKKKKKKKKKQKTNYSEMETGEFYDKIFG